MRRIAVRAIVVHDDKLLLVKLKSFNSGPYADFYCTIGGGLDENEGLIEGVRREVLEETGVNATVGRLLFIQQYKDKQNDLDNIEFFFHVSNSEDFNSVDVSQSTHGDIEIREIGFYEPDSVNTLPAFLKEIDVRRVLSEPDVKFFNYL